MTAFEPERACAFGHAVTVLGEDGQDNFPLVGFNPLGKRPAAGNRPRA